jgi:branched-chain amino acid transport system substrate-binding protein
MQGASAGDTTGVTATEIKIGHTNPYSGPASSYSSSGKLETAFFNKMVNDQGGIAGRKINFMPTMTSRGRRRLSSRCDA